MSPVRGESGGPLCIGEQVRIRGGTFAGQTGEVVGYHWRPSYPVVRLVVFGQQADAWFHEAEVERLQPPPRP